MAQEFISFQQLFTQLPNETGNYTRLLLIIVEVLNQFFSGDSNWDSCVPHPVDIVHHEMDSVVHSHHVYTPVWSPVIEHLILEKEPAGQCTQ